RQDERRGGRGGRDHPRHRPVDVAPGPPADPHGAAPQQPHGPETMKRSHIIAIVIIAVAITALVGSLYDSSTYADLKQAFDNPEREYHVVGVLDRSQEVIYEASINPIRTTFSMVDHKGDTARVRLSMAKPQDFER